MGIEELWQALHFIPRSFTGAVTAYCVFMVAYLFVSGRRDWPKLELLDRLALVLAVFILSLFGVVALDTFLKSGR